jgi:hypothetical protein
MIVPQGKKCLNCSLGQLELFVLKEKLISPRNNELPLGKGQVHKGNICSEFFRNKSHLIIYIYI